MTAVKKFQAFQGRAALGTWLTGILRNKILDHLRHLKRHPEAPATADENSPETDPTPRNWPNAPRFALPCSSAWIASR